ncbi:MAG: hypothetical protein ACRDOI_04895 [Trebonia sp.]
MPVVGVLVVVGVSLLAAAGVFVLERLVPAKRREPHNEVFGFVYAVVGVFYAVILGMVMVSAWNRLDTARSDTYSEADAVLQLYWYGQSLPQPQRAEVEGLAREYTTVVIKVEWPMLARKQASPRAESLSIRLRALVQAQQPTTPAAVARYQQALNEATGLGDARQARIDLGKDGISGLLTAGIVLGGVITVGFAFLFGMKSRRVHVLVMFSLTLLASFMLLITYEFSYPFAGAANVGPEKFQMALHYMQVVSASQERR